MSTPTSKRNPMDRGLIKHDNPVLARTREIAAYLELDADDDYELVIEDHVLETLDWFPWPTVTPDGTCDAGSKVDHEDKTMTVGFARHMIRGELSDRLTEHIIWHELTHLLAGKMSHHDRDGFFRWVAMSLRMDKLPLIGNRIKYVRTKDSVEEGMIDVMALVLRKGYESGKTFTVVDLSTPTPPSRGDVPSLPEEGQRTTPKSVDAGRGRQGIKP